MSFRRPRRRGLARVTSSFCEWHGYKANAQKDSGAAGNQRVCCLKSEVLR